MPRLADRGVDLQPVVNRRHFAKRHAHLRHAKRAGIHPEKQHPFFATAVSVQKLLVRRPGIVERL